MVAQNAKGRLKIIFSRPFAFCVLTCMCSYTCTSISSLKNQPYCKGIIHFAIRFIFALGHNL